jgi:hypothetical protein
MEDSGMTEEPRQDDRGAQGNAQKGVPGLLIGAAIAGAVLLITGRPSPASGVEQEYPRAN